jgi:uncharacterized repeat protein (TIGR04042 family)
MPEVLLDLEWPDGRCTRFYSPSTVVLEHLPPGSEWSVAELRAAGLAALAEASERVRARYGFACSRTDEEAAKLRQLTSLYDPQERVRVQPQRPAPRSPGSDR